MNDTCRIVVLISGSGSNLQAIIDAVQAGHIRGNIIAVISNRPAVKGLQRAASADIQTITIDHRQFESRSDFDTELDKQLAALAPDLIVLAGFMRILPAPLVTRYQGKMLNIHPSLLPRHRGLHTHRRALEAGDKEHGASVHFVTPELDGGPVIIQARLPVQAHHTADSLAADVLTFEHQIYPLAVSYYCDGRLSLDGDRIRFDGRHIDQPLRFPTDIPASDLQHFQS